MLISVLFSNFHKPMIITILNFFHHILWILAVIFMTLALTIPGPLMRIFTSDPEVIAEGVKYLRIVGISYSLGFSKASFSALFSKP